MAINMNIDVKKEKIIWIELLRICACFGVIVMHVASHYIKNVSLDSFQYVIFNIYHGLVKFVIPCFIMISGLLYLDKEKKISLGKMYKKYIMPLFIAYIFWSIIYAIFSIFCIKKNEFKTLFDMCKAIIKTAAVDSYFHLWYLPMFIGLLIITPIIKEVINGENEKRMTQYMIFLFIIFQILPNTILNSGVADFNAAKAILDKFQIQLICSYIGYFVLGYYLYNYKLSEKIEKFLYVLGPISAMAGIALCNYFSVKQGKCNTHFYNTFSVFTFLFTISLFIFFKNKVSKIKVSQKAEKIICHLGSCTLGIYLIHALFRDIFKKNHIDAMMINPILSVPLISILIFIVSYFCIAMLKKIKYINKYII